MALAKICDRCGKAFGYTREELERGVYLAKLVISEDAAQKFGIECRESISRCYEMDLDLCQNCWEDLSKWLKERPIRDDLIGSGVPADKWEITFKRKGETE